MKQITLTLEDAQHSVINAATKGTGETLEQWIDNKLESIIKSQRKANLNAELRGFAAACKLTVSTGAYDSVETFVLKNGIGDKVTELGGLGQFVLLLNNTKVRGVDAYIPESKIHAIATIVSAADVKAGK